MRGWLALDRYTNTREEMSERLATGEHEHTNYVSVLVRRLSVRHCNSGTPKSKNPCQDHPYWTIDKAETLKLGFRKLIRMDEVYEVFIPLDGPTCIWVGSMWLRKTSGNV